MSKVEIGDRVGAILSADKDTVKLIGYGTFQGNKVPPEGSAGMGSMLHQAGVSNPCIRLDDGSLVFGYECWWGSEEAIKSKIGDRQVIQVDMTKERAS